MTLRISLEDTKMRLSKFHIGRVIPRMLAIPPIIIAQTVAERIKLLEATLQDLLRCNEEKDRVIEKLISEVKALGGSRWTIASTHKEEADHDHGGSFWRCRVSAEFDRYIAATTARYSPKTGAVTRTLQ